LRVQFETKCAVPKNIHLEQREEQGNNAVTHQIFKKIYIILFSLLSRPDTSRYLCAGLLMIRSISSLQKFWSPQFPIEQNPWNKRHWT